jgi:hypothetical protein
VGNAKKRNLMAYVIDSEWWDFPKREFDGLCNGFGRVGIAKKGNLMDYVINSEWWDFPERKF